MTEGIERVNGDEKNKITKIKHKFLKVKMFLFLAPESIILNSLSPDIHTISLSHPLAAFMESRTVCSWKV